MDLLEQSGAIVLPRRSIVPKTADDDPIDFYYRRLTAHGYRLRLRIAGELLGERQFERLLEIGYGSGIFVPELARRARSVAAIDIHPNRAAVARMAEQLGIQVELRDAPIEQIPYADGEFDAVVCLSVLEHIQDLSRPLEEMRRVLAPGGVAVLGFPVRNLLTDTFFRLAGYRPREIHPSSHRDIVGAVERDPHLELERVVHSPRLVPRPLAGYVVCRCRAR